MKSIGIPFTDPQGAYFVLADIAPFLKPGQTDVAFCEEMAQKVGVACVPGTSFFKEKVNNIVRLHFAKKDETLVAALDPPQRHQGKAELASPRLTQKAHKTIL